MAKFTKETLKKMLDANQTSIDIHQKYLISALKLPVKPAERLSTNDAKTEQIIKKLKENGFEEISGEMQDKYLQVYARYTKLYAGLVLHKDGHDLLASVREPRYWSDFYITLIDINKSNDPFIIEANTPEQAIYAVDNYEEAEKIWEKQWSVEMAKMSKLMDINQNTLDIVLSNVAQKHKLDYAIEKDRSKQTTLSLRLSGRQQLTMKFKKSISTETIVNLSNIISQLVDVINTNKDIDITLRGVIHNTNWIKPDKLQSNKDEE